MLRTEQRDERFREMDTWKAPDIASGLAESLHGASSSVLRVSNEIGTAASVAADLLKYSKGRLCYCGAGTPGRLGVQDGVELTPTFGWPEARLLYFIAGGADALLHSIEGAEDRVEDAVYLCEKNKIGPTDVIVAISASGTTPFTLACVQEAKRRGALTIGIVNNFGTPIFEAAAHRIFLDTGPEPIAGSTRMKAGAAQRIALTTLSTTIMALLGGVFNGDMVDVQDKCQKLTKRRSRILQRITGVSEKFAKKALDESGGDIKVAAIMLHACCKVHEAKDLLRKNDYYLRRALEAHDRSVSGKS